MSGQASKRLGSTSLYEPKAERFALGCVLSDPPVLDVLRSQVTVEDFGTPAHATIFSAMLRVAARGQLADHLTLADELKVMGQLVAVGGPAYLMGLDAMATVPGLESACNILRDRANRRRARAAALAAYEASEDLSIPVATTLSTATSTFARISTRGNKLVTLRQLKQVVKKEVEDRHDGKFEPTVLTGFERFDKLTGGLPYNLIILAAMGGVGKSALIASLVLRIAFGALREDGTREPGKRVGILSLEDPAKWVGYRILSAQSGIRSSRLRHRKFTSEEWEAFGRAWEELEDYDDRIIIDDRQRLTAAEVTQTVRELVVVHGCKLVIVDNATAVRFPRVREENKTEAIQEWLGDLREIGTTHGAAVMTVHHIKRRDGLEPKHIPKMSDVKDSSGAENMGRLLLLAARDKGSNLFRLELAKQTDGDAGDIIDMFFDMEAQMVRERTSRDEQESTPDGFPLPKPGEEKGQPERPRKRRKGEKLVPAPEESPEDVAA